MTKYHSLDWLCHSKMSSPGQVILFHPTHIIKEGYLTKSPPLDVETLIRKRWRLRWFVLCYIEDEPRLYYFKNEKYRNQLKPKGKKNWLIQVDLWCIMLKVNPIQIQEKKYRNHSKLLGLCLSDSSVFLST